MPGHEIKIRPFTADDHSAVVSLWNEIFAGDPNWNESGTMIRLKMSVQPELFFVASIDGRVIGTVMAGFDGVRGWIHRLAVHPSSRRMGVAAKLMKAAEKGLRAIGCPKVNLQVRTDIRSDTVDVVEFYRKLGYTIEQRVSMGKRLGSEPAETES